MAQKREEIARLKGSRRLLEGRAEEARAGRRDFRAALAAKAPAIIAEIKRASPSRGLLTPNFDPMRQACAYQQGGAAALSVLTDSSFFLGSLAHLAAARSPVRLPVLRKDFTLARVQVLEAAAGHADAVLLIAAILEKRRLRELREFAAQLGLSVLVEVHNERELEMAMECGADLIGVNNRDLNTFEVSLGTALRLAPRIPAGVVRVAESGIHSAQDVRRLRDAGYQAFLVGEHLMKSGDPARAVEDLLRPQ